MRLDLRSDLILNNPFIVLQFKQIVNLVMCKGLKAIYNHIWAGI